MVSDFIAGAAEWLSPDNDPDHWDIIEGQGSRYHLAYAGVTLGLIHGSQPDALVICHEPARTFLLSVPAYPVPALSAFIEMNLAAARPTNRAVVAAGISINTSLMSETETIEAVRAIEAETGLPCCDPIVMAPTRSRTICWPPWATDSVNRIGNRTRSESCLWYGL